MIDFHTHIIPNIDDGAYNDAIAREMIDEELQDEVHSIILTPHIRYKSDEFLSCQKLEDIFEDFYYKFKTKGVEFFLGGEIYYVEGVIDALLKNEIMTINKSKYILIEFNLFYEINNIRNVIADVVANGFKPILAHPERYAYVNVEKMREYRDLGAIIQIDSSSILGDFGRKPKKLAHKLLKRGLVDLISSDCHSVGTRRPNLKRTVEYITKKYGEDTAKTIFETNAKQILEEIKQR